MTEMSLKKSRAMCARDRRRDKAVYMTHCKPISAGPTSIPVTSGATTVDPIRASWRKVLYLLIVVGRTSAEGRLKSQYLVKVFGGGSDIHR